MPDRSLEFVVRSLASAHPEDAARALEALNSPEAARLVRRLPARTAGAVVERLSASAGAGVLRELGKDASTGLLAALQPRQAAAILAQFDEALRSETLEGMSRQEARRLRGLLDYPPDTAGGMMHTRVATVHADVSVREAVAALRRAPRTTLFYL